MDKYRPKRPTTLALFPQLPQAGTQDSINNNSLGNDSWKDSHSSSPHITVSGSGETTHLYQQSLVSSLPYITALEARLSELETRLYTLETLVASQDPVVGADQGDVTQSDVEPKAEDKVQHSTQRRPAPKPPTAHVSNSRANPQAAAAGSETQARPRERLAPRATHTQSSSTPRSQRRAGSGGGLRGGGKGATAMRERSLGGLRGKDGVTDGRGGRLCEESKSKERNGHQRPREANGLKGRAADGRGRGGTKGGNRGGSLKSNKTLSNQEVYLPAMVVPRTPVAPRNLETTQNQDQNHDRTQDNPSVLSQSSSEGGSNRMSLSSDTEGPPLGPLHPSLSHRSNPDISEEEGEGDPTPCLNFQKGLTCSLTGNGKTETDCTSETVLEKCDSIVASVANWTAPNSESAAGLNYDAVKYTLVVDEHAQLKLVNLKDCLNGYSEHNDDSDAETVYQSANEEEDPQYEKEKKKSEEARRQERREVEEKRRKEEEAKKRREEEVRRKREEEVKRRRDIVMRFCKQAKVTSSTTSEDEESTGGRVCAPRSRKFLNLFAKNSSHYSATGAGSFGMFSCVLDGVERQQSHRAVYRFVPRHGDELDLEADDPVLMLNQSKDLWCQGYNMRTGAVGIFPAFYVVRVPREIDQVQNDGWIEKFLVRFLGSVQVPIHTGNDVLCAAMQKVAHNRRSACQPPSACVLEVSVKGVKISVQDECHSAHRGDQCFHFFQLKNISFCGSHPKHSKYFGFITKHPDQQRFACHVLMSETTSHPLAESVGRAFQQYYKKYISYSCPTEDIFIE